MTSSGSLDTCAILRLFLTDIPDQHERIKLLIEQQDSAYHVSDLAIVESIYVLEKGYGFTKKAIEDYLQALISQPNLNLNRQAFLTALPLYRAHTSISFNDCLLATYAKQNEALPLFTFDKSLAKKLPETVEL
jgi:predicted nucleic-acid-binding protein